MKISKIRAKKYLLDDAKSGQIRCNCRTKLIGEENYRFRIERGKI